MFNFGPFDGRFSAETLKTDRNVTSRERVVHDGKTVYIATLGAIGRGLRLVQFTSSFTTSIEIAVHDGNF